jgi:class 3 adenylate cyclase
MKRRLGYADSGGVQIAYEVVGEGERDFILVYEWGTNLDWMDASPDYSWMRDEIAQFGRVIHFDLRGTGQSERVASMPPLEEWVEDIVAVMAATNCESATLIGHGHASQLCMLFAAMYPDRTDALILLNGFARLSRDVDYPDGYPPKARAALLAAIRQYWGTGQVIAFTCPTHAAMPGGLEELARIERATFTPARAARFQAGIFALDVRDVLPAISSPTLVLHSSRDAFAGPEHGRYLAEHIPGARHVEIAMDHGDHDVLSKAALGDHAEEWRGHIRAFIENPRPAPLATRSLMTVAFTDIVDSTQKAADLGDAAWRQLLEKHESLARRHVERASGRVVKFTGDGMMATFEGPARAIECLHDLGARLDEAGLPIRAGVHTGEVELIGDDIGGLGVHIAARVAAKADAREIVVSSTVRDLVAGSGIDFSDKGQHELKGVPGTWQLLSVK